MKKILLALAAIASLCANVQAQNVEGQVVASQYGEFRVQGEGNGFSFDPAACQVAGGGKNFPAFSLGAPIKIVDGNPSLTEIATPVGVFITSSYCSVSMTTANQHQSFYLTSGTGGLQEALNAAKIRVGGPNTIILNAEWYELVAPGNPATVIGAVTGGTGWGLVDVTTAPYTNYTWNGTHFVSAGSGGSVASVFGRTGTVVAATNDYIVSQVTGAAPLASPALTGSPTAPTQAPGDNSTKIATTAYVAANGAVPSVFGRSGAVTAQSGDYSVGQVTGAAPLASPALTGNPTAITQAALDATTKIATDQFVQTALGTLPNGATATTQPNGDNTTKVATDAFVQASASTLATYSSKGAVYGGIGYVNPSMITGGITDAFAAINAVGATLPTGSLIDATALGTATYTVTTQLTALNQTNKAIVLMLSPGTRFQINTVFSSPTNAPTSCAVPVGGAKGSAGTGSAIIVPGYNALNANFFLGTAAVVWDVICNGDFLGNQENVHLDGVVVAGNPSATMSGALMHLAGVFVPTSIVNSGTLQCYGQCLELDAGTTGTGGPALGNIQFVNDNFEDGATSGTYPGSVVNIDTLANTGQTSNINFYGGMIELNGPHNPLFTVHGRASIQSDSIGLFGTTFQGASASPAATYTTTASASSGATTLTVASSTNLAPGQMVTGTGIAVGTFVADSYTSGTSIPITIGTTAILSSGSVVFSPNVDPIQLKDTSSFYVSNLRFRGNNNTTWQQNLVDIGGSGTNTDFGINLDQVTAFTGQFTCLVRNSVEGTCETGFPTGWGDNALPNYTFGQMMPADRRTNYAPPSAACNIGTLGTIWTNSTAANGAGSICQLVSGTPTWAKLPVLGALGQLSAVAHAVTGTTFSVTGCGTATSLVGGSTAGKFTGGSATCTPVVTMGGSYTAPIGFSCSVQDRTTSTAAFRQTADSTTTATFTAGGTVGATDVISFNCTPY